MVIGAVFSATAINHRGVELRQHERVAGDQRQFLRHLGVERGFHRRRGELHRNGSFLDGDGFRHGANFHSRVDGNVGAGLDENVLLLESPESFEFHLHGVSARKDEIKQVLTDFVGRGGIGDRRIVVGQRDAGAGNDRAARIGNRTGYPSTKFLGLDVRRERQREHQTSKKHQEAHWASWGKAWFSVHQRTPC